MYHPARIQTYSKRLGKYNMWTVWFNVLTIWPLKYFSWSVTKQKRKALVCLPWESVSSLSPLPIEMTCELCGFSLPVSHWKEVICSRFCYTYPATVLRIFGLHVKCLQIVWCNSWIVSYMIIMEFRFYFVSFSSPINSIDLGVPPPCVCVCVRECRHVRHKEPLQSFFFSDKRQSEGF